MISLAVACLAMTVYFEAGNQPHAGQVAVATVVMNRVENDSYPATVCGVVKQGGESRRYQCQFSWYCDGKSDIPYSVEAWESAVLIAQDVLAGSRMASLRDATHYHADYVKPYWAHHYEQVAVIGNHIFYRKG